MLYKIRCNPMYSLYGALPVLYVPVQVTSGAVFAHRYTYATTRWSTSRLLFPCQYLCGTILVTPYSMVWDWRVSRAGPIPFYWRGCSLSFCLLMFSLSLFSFYGLVLWYWGVWTDRVLMPSPYLALPTFLIIITITAQAPHYTSRGTVHGSHYTSRGAGTSLYIAKYKHLAPVVRKMISSRTENSVAPAQC